MNTPKKIAISRLDIVDMSVKLPEGKEIFLKQGTHYITDVAAEIDFLSQQKGLCVVDLDDKEFKSWVTSRIIPSVENAALTDTQAAPFVWKDEYEDIAIAELKKRGYRVQRMKKATGDNAKDNA